MSRSGWHCEALWFVLRNFILGRHELALVAPQHMACHIVRAMDRAVPYWDLVPVPIPTPHTKYETTSPFSFGKFQRWIPRSTRM